MPALRADLAPAVAMPLSPHMRMRSMSDLSADAPHAFHDLGVSLGFRACSTSDLSADSPRVIDLFLSRAGLSNGLAPRGSSLGTSHPSSGVPSCLSGPIASIITIRSVPSHVDLAMDLSAIGVADLSAA